MKKISQILILLCLCLILVPTDVHATEVKSDFFTVDFEIGEYNCIGPGDIIQDAIKIKNTTKHELKVRVYDVDNVGNSKLYSALKVGWKEAGKAVAYTTFDKLAPTDWYFVQKDQTLELPMRVYFPIECGNEYQGATLAAKFIVEARIPEEAIGWDTDATKDKTNPKTGDNFNLHAWGIVCTASGCLLLIILMVANKRKKDKKA